MGESGHDDNFGVWLNDCRFTSSCIYSEQKEPIAAHVSSMFWSRNFNGNFSRSHVTRGELKKKKVILNLFLI